MPAAKRGQRAGSTRGNVKVMAINMRKQQKFEKLRCVPTMEISKWKRPLDSMTVSVLLCGSEQKKKQKVHNDVLLN